MINRSLLEEATEQSATVTSSNSAGSRSSTTLRNGYLKVGYQLSQWEEDLRKDFQYCVNPNSPNQFLSFEQFKNIQEIMLLISCIARQCTVTERTHRVHLPRRERELVEFSIIGNGWIPGGKSLKRGRQAVFFSTANPMEDVHDIKEIPCDLSNPRIAPYKNTWKRLQNTKFWCNLKLAWERGLQFQQTRSDAVVLYNTLPAACIEKAVCMNTQDELDQKVRLIPRVPRVLRKSNSHYGLHHDARSSLEPSSDSKSYGEICNTVDHRIPGVPFSAVEQQKTPRENKVKRLIEKDRHRRSTSSAKNLKSWSPTWTTPRSSNFAKILPNSHVLTAVPANVLQLWNKYEIFAESNGVRPEQPWRHLNPWIRDQEEQQSWSQARTFWETKDVLPG